MIERQSFRFNFWLARAHNTHTHLARLSILPCGSTSHIWKQHTAFAEKLLFVWTVYGARTPAHSVDGACTPNQFHLVMRCTCTKHASNRHSQRIDSRIPNNKTKTPEKNWLALSSAPVCPLSSACEIAAAQQTNALSTLVTSCRRVNRDDPKPLWTWMNVTHISSACRCVLFAHPEMALSSFTSRRPHFTHRHASHYSFCTEWRRFIPFVTLHSRRWLRPFPCTELSPFLMYLSLLNAGHCLLSLSHAVFILIQLILCREAKMAGWMRRASTWPRKKEMSEMKVLYFIQMAQQKFPYDELDRFMFDNWHDPDVISSKTFHFAHNNVIVTCDGPSFWPGLMLNRLELSFQWSCSQRPTRQFPFLSLSSAAMFTFWILKQHFPLVRQ